MKVVPYSSEHYREVSGWYLARGRIVVPALFLPKNGAVISDVCAAFLYLTDSPVAFIDALISNPAASPAKVADGIEAIVEHLSAAAKVSGCKLLVFTAERPGVSSLGHRLGFRRVAGYGVMMAKEL